MKPNSVQAVTAIVPCSTSNLGSGFDTLGLALNLYTRVTVARRAERSVRLVDASPAEVPGARALCAEAVDLFFRTGGLPAFGAEISVTGEVPVARGLGFSSTLRAGIVAGLNALSGSPLPGEALLHLVTQLEGHPDNASPAVLGGFTASGIVGGETRCLRFEVDSRLKAVTLIPNFHIRTDAARELIPKHFSKSDAAHALNRAALIVAAFASKNYDALQGVFDDRFHQPHRLKLIPQLDRVIAAGVEAGAIGGFLSGSGSGIICLTLENADAVAAAMQSQLPESEMRILTPENKGVRVEPA
jgi:homoserine kinase